MPWHFQIFIEMGGEKQMSKGELNFIKEGGKTLIYSYFG